MQAQELAAFVLGGMLRARVTLTLAGYVAETPACPQCWGMDDDAEQACHYLQQVLVRWFQSPT